MNWIIDNKEWIFSGIGVVILGGIINFIKSKSEAQNNISSGDNSTNIQSCKNITINNLKNKGKNEDNE